MNIKYLFGWKITFEALLEGNIPFEIGHLRVMETNVTNGLFGLSSYVFKIWTRSSRRMWETRLEILCIVFESQFGIIILKIMNLCFAFAHQTMQLSFFLQLYASLPTRQWVKFPYLGRLEANMPFEKRHIWGKHENKGKCENTIYFPHMMVHTNFEKTFKRIILTGIFIPGVLLKRSDLYFKYFDAIWTYNIKNQNFKKEKIRTISIFFWTSQMLCGIE